MRAKKSAIMSYGKKDEDGEGAVLKVDRTAVFQEGRTTPAAAHRADILTCNCSSIVQLLANLSSKMSYTTYKDRPPPFHGGVISLQ